MAQAPRDENRVTTLIGTSNVDGITPIVVYADPVTHRLLVDIPSGSGSVTTVSVVTANGFAGTVATASTTPAITLSTTITGVLKGNGTAISAAAAGTDYQAPITLTTTGTSGAATLIANTLNIPNYAVGGSGITIGTTTITSGTTTRVLYNNAGVVGEYVTSGSGNVAMTTNAVFTTPNLGTPSALTLTNATGLPIAGLVASTSTAIGVGTVELGNASDTTLSRSAAGVLAVEGVVIPSISSTNILTNKAIVRRLITVNAPGATPTTTIANVDIANFTGLATNITSMSTNLSGTPADGTLLEYRFTDDGTPRTIAWGGAFGATTVALPTTTVASTMLRVLFESNGSILQCIAVA